MTDFSKLLNPEQYTAATAADGPLLVLAAAGTGKTRTLVHRVAYLVEQGVPADRILLLTFTNRAAREMMERAEKVVGAEACAIWSGTFHSICARFLRRYGTFLGYRPNFSIIDEDDQKKLLNEIIKTTAKSPKDFPKKEIVAKIISEAMNEAESVEDIAARWQTREAGIVPDEIAKVAKVYETRKKELNAMDFDDLLVNGLKLLKTQDRVREMFQEHFLYVLVDEYQDTNGLQAEFTDILAARHRNIMAVGDDFQCIYTWRGAQIENILTFPERWQGCKVIKLERNYRSVPGILSVANCVMKDTPQNFEKELRPVRENRGFRPVVYSVYDGRTQAAEILNRIQNARECGYRYSDMAILYRSHFQSIEIQLTLARQGIPIRITSGVGVFEQIHVKDVLAYLRLLLSDSDELSFRRFVSLFPGVGEKTALNLWTKMSHRFNCHDAADRDKLGQLLGSRAKVVWPALSKCFADAEGHLHFNEIGKLIGDFLDFYYEDYLTAEWEETEAEERTHDILELANQIASAEGGLAGFLADVALFTNLDAQRNNLKTDSLTLSTVHQAKGMEWPIVFVPWCTNGMFPSAKAMDEGRLPEERRLFYVVVTRAKDELFLFVPSMRVMPDRGVVPVEESVFVKEIPEELIEERTSKIYLPPLQPRQPKFFNTPKPTIKTYWRR